MCQLEKASNYTVVEMIKYFYLYKICRIFQEKALNLCVILPILRLQQNINKDNFHPETGQEVITVSSFKLDKFPF